MKKLKQLLGKSFKVVMFIAFTIIWSLSYILLMVNGFTFSLNSWRCVVLGNHKLAILEEKEKKKRAKSELKVGLMLFFLPS